MNNNYVLELKNVSKSFVGVGVLDDVSFNLRPGEVHALLGENGAGKSTMVKVITGFHQPDSGEIILDGKAVQFSNTRESLHSGIAAIYQELSLFPDLNVAENIFIGRQPTSRGGRIDWHKMYIEAERLLASLGVKLDLKQKARSLSIAQQQMVEIARAISINAHILIMDEPTSSLTLNEVADLFRLVNQLRKKGTAILFISHRLEEIFEIADRVTVLRDGELVETRQTKDVTQQELILMMVGTIIGKGKTSKVLTRDQMIKDESRRDIKRKTQRKLAPGNVVLKVKNLSKEGAFEDISFELHEGEILGVAGLVGAGRTNVARAIFGVEPATSGTIEIDGKEMQITSPQQTIELGMAYVPEDRQLHGLIPAMDLTKNISLPMLNRYTMSGWLRNSEELESAYDAACQMEVRANNIWQKARELSGGNQQKVVLAKWLSMKPRILILDEPTRGIDVGTKATVHGLISQLAASGIAILMISSELPEILGMSDRIIVMYEGKQTAHFDQLNATREKVLAAATNTLKTGSEK